MSDPGVGQRATVILINNKQKGYEYLGWNCLAHKKYPAPCSSNVAMNTLHPPPPSPVCSVRNFHAL